MAKIAKVGYGSHGQGLGDTTDGYTYVVNDNVRTRDVIQVIATARDKTTKFVTTGVPLHVYSENSKTGAEEKQKIESKTGKDITQSYSGKELGLPNPGKQKKTVQVGEQKKQTAYSAETRAANVGMYMQQNPNAELSKNARETFESYSKNFKN